MYAELLAYKGEVSRCIWEIHKLYVIWKDPGTISWIQEMKNSIPLG